MDPIQNEEHKTAHHEHHITYPPVVEQQEESIGAEPNKFKTAFVKFYKRLGQFSYLEIIGMIAIAVIILDQFFAFSITVNRKPLLQKLLGEKVQTLPPQLADHMSQAPAAPTAAQPAAPQAAPADPALIAQVLPSAGIELPVTWGDLGKQMVASGVIDQQKFTALYAQRGGLSAEDTKMLTEGSNGKIKITNENSGTILNLLWALGLGNSNPILEKGGEMYDQKYGGDPSKFASTGGWTISSGQPMDHFSKHMFIRLTAGQQQMVEEVSKNIFRPCCGNSTHMPDCNHGMAMLGLLELMASQGVSKADMYKYALSVNSYWFPNNYLTIASYFKSKGTDWSKVDPKVILSAQYSSGQGYQQLVQQVTPQQAPQSKGGCGV